MLWYIVCILYIYTYPDTQVQIWGRVATVFLPRIFPFLIMPGVLVLISWYLWFLCLGASCIFLWCDSSVFQFVLRKSARAFFEASHQTEPLVLKVLNILMQHLQFQGWNQCVFVVWVFLFNAWIDCVLWVFLDMQRTTRGKEPLHPGFGEAVIRLYKVLPICWRLCHNETYIFRFLDIYIHLHS